MMFKNIRAYLWYPLCMVSAIALFQTMLSAKLPLIAATYLPIIGSGLIVIGLERFFPARADWQPRRADIKADIAFMATIQIVWPRLLMLVCVLLFSDWMHMHAQSGLWPHDWPLAAQIIAMLLAVDFMRYWLHRACHRYTLLWRLHEVHHSPDILYILNVARFHPLEKTLHFALDTLPFLLLGVTPEVIAGYFLLYSVNGFFQHSNLHLNYGWLNYVVGSAQTHRWHHARDPKIASCNFGNTVIVWDLLFGTWYLPKKSTVANIGIMDRTYPKEFRTQMLTPFRRADGRPRRRFITWLADILMTAYLCWIRFVEQHRIKQLARDPMKKQHALLARLLHENRNTTFGKRHGFTHINDYQAFAAQIPVNEYEDLRPFINAEIQQEKAVLTADTPFHYVRTSGTTGQSKDLPLTRAHLTALRRLHHQALAFQYRTCPEAFPGSILTFVSPSSEGILANGKSFGSASGIVASDTPFLLKKKFVVPAIVTTISDSKLKYLLILRLALVRCDLSYIGAANPSTLLNLMQLYRQHAAILIDDILHGKFFLSDQLPDAVLIAIQHQLHANPKRADELARLHAADKPVHISNLWPALRLIVCWTCASARIAANALRKELTPSTHVMELGYIASELRGTITLGKNAGTGLPTLDTHFFEFIEREKWDNASQSDKRALTLLMLDSLRKGVDYYLIVTTPSGLYRYFMNDLVRVSGFLHKTPLLKFIQKGKGVTNITGEKLYEAQVLDAMHTAQTKHGLSTHFFIMLADEEKRVYRLYIEPDNGNKFSTVLFAATVDQELARGNIEYQAKRESQRLDMLKVYCLAAGTGEKYKQSCVQQGQREGQFKMVTLLYQQDFHFDLEEHFEQESTNGV